jgi:hypothetical protein
VISFVRDGPRHRQRQSEQTMMPTIAASKILPADVSPAPALAADQRVGPASGDSSKLGIFGIAAEF